MPFDLKDMNWLAVVVAAVATFLIGGVWYAGLFAKPFQRLNGYSDAQLAEMRRRRPPPVFFGILLVCYFVMAFTVALIVNGLGLRVWMSGLVVGFALWVLVVAIQASGHVASSKPWSALGLDAAYQLIYLLMSGALIAGWR